MKSHYRRRIKETAIHHDLTVASTATSKRGAHDLAQTTIQVSAVAALAWSALSFSFAIGFIFRIDPSVLAIISISDVFSISFSYLVYLFPLIVLAAVIPMQFFIPAPTRFDDVEILPIHIISRVPKPLYVGFLFILAVALPALLVLDAYYHFIDRSSLLYKTWDIIQVGISTFLAFCGFLILAKNGFRNRDRVVVYGSLASVILVFYLSGDYISSRRMNNPKVMDCAVLSGSDRCYPVLLWSRDFFVTWSGEKIRAIKSDKVDHLWLHPNKEPDVRVLP